MQWFSNIGVSNVIGLILLALAAASAFGVRLFCKRKGYSEEKSADTVYRGKVLAIVLGIAGTVLVTDVVRF